MEKCLCPAIGVGLECTDNPPISKVLRHLEQRMKLAGVVCIVVVDFSAMIGAFIFKPPASSGKGGKAIGDSLARTLQELGSGGCGKGIHYIVHAANLQLYMTIKHSPNHYIKGREPVLPAEILHVAIRSLLHTKRKKR